MVLSHLQKVRWNPRSCRNEDRIGNENEEGQGEDETVWIPMGDLHMLKLWKERRNQNP